MKTYTRLLVALGLLFAQLSAVAATHTVLIRNFEYSPQFLTIQPGDVVHFQWVEGVHPTVSDSNPAAFPTFTLGSSAPSRDVTFSSAGQFDYHCTAHGAPQSGMWGRITVSTATPAQAATTLSSSLLNVYPNPVRGMATISLGGDFKASQDYRLRVSNIIGREVRSVALRPELAQSGQSVDLSALPTGIYFCTLLANDKAIATRRVTVQN